MKASVIKYVKIGNKRFTTTEEIADYVKKHGKTEPETINGSYMRVIPIEGDNNLVTESGNIAWINENGHFVSKSGYCYDISCFTN